MVPKKDESRNRKTDQYISHNETSRQEDAPTVIIPAGEQKSGDATLILPSVEDACEYLSESKQWDLGRRVLNPLFFVDVQVKDCSDGYVVVRKDAFLMNKQPYDVPVGRSVVRVEKDSFYTIPVHPRPAKDEEEMKRIACEQFRQTGMRRYFIHEVEGLKPFLVDVTLDREVTSAVTPVFEKTLASILAMLVMNNPEQGRNQAISFKNRIGQIRKEFEVAYQAPL